MWIRHYIIPAACFVWFPDDILTQSKTRSQTFERDYTLCFDWWFTFFCLMTQLVMPVAVAHNVNSQQHIQLHITKILDTKLWNKEYITSRKVRISSILTSRGKMALFSAYHGNLPSNPWNKRSLPPPKCPRNKLSWTGSSSSPLLFHPWLYDVLSLTLSTYRLYPSSQIFHHFPS